MDYSAQVQKSADLHIKDGLRGVICIFKINMNALQLSKFIRSSRFFSEHPLIDYPAQV